MKSSLNGHLPFFLPIPYNINSQHHRSRWESQVCLTICYVSVSRDLEWRDTPEKANM
jgi:hypothetical protein